MSKNCLSFGPVFLGSRCACLHIFTPLKRAVWQPPLKTKVEGSPVFEEASQSTPEEQAASVQPVVPGQGAHCALMFLPACTSQPPTLFRPPTPHEGQRESEGDAAFYRQPVALPLWSKVTQKPMRPCGKGLCGAPFSLTHSYPHPSKVPLSSSYLFYSLTKAAPKL